MSKFLLSKKVKMRLSPPKHNKFKSQDLNNSLLSIKSWNDNEINDKNNF